MNIYDTAKKTAFKFIDFYNKNARAVRDVSKRNRKVFIQFVSMQRKSKKDTCKKHKLNGAEKKAVDELFVNNYGSRIPYRWHEFFSARANVFDAAYIPMSIYLAEVEYFMNPYHEYIRTFENKYIISMIAKAAGVKTPRTLFMCSDGQLIDQRFKIVSFKIFAGCLHNIGEIFIKPASGAYGGAGCSLYNIVDGRDVLSGDSVEEIVRRAGNNFIVQNVVRNHSTISDLYGKSLNTFRVVTYMWKNVVYNAPVVMRLGRNGSYVDNASSGGLYVAVEENGRLHETAFSDTGEQMHIHPDSKIVFGGYKIIPITEMLEEAKKMHRALPMMGIINWDFSIDETGSTVLIEANVSGGGIDMIQIAWGKGLFGDRTAEVLRWLKLMKSTPADKRKEYYFGRGLK